MPELNREVPTKFRKILFQNDEFEVVSIEWENQALSALHDHGWSQCFVLIEEGVFDVRLDLGAKTEFQILKKGQIVCTPRGAKHEVRCRTPSGKTIHFYTPRIKELNDSGVFRARLNDNLKSEMTLSDPTQIDVLQNILAKFEAQSISTHSPYFMNQLFAGILPLTLMADEFIAKTKTTLATFEASPVLSMVEKEVVGALCRQIGWQPEQHDGIGVPGGSAANFMALQCARQYAMPDAKEKGMRGTVFKVFASAEAHYSLKKACAVLGLGTDHLISVPVDGKGRMIPQALNKLVLENQGDGIRPLLVVATAGTTVLGAFDEITPLSVICKNHGLWLHVDGAWGGPALFSKQLRPLVNGIEFADSVTFDAHKLFGASLTTSFFLTRHHEILLEANDVSGGDYLFHSEDRRQDRGKLSWQCGRKADALSFWTIWKSLGTEGLGDFVDHLVAIRQEALAWIKTQPRLELIADPEFLNVCVRVLPPDGSTNRDWSKSVREQLKNSDHAMVNYSTNQQGTFLRLILAHPFLKFDHVRKILSWALAVN